MNIRSKIFLAGISTLFLLAGMYIIGWSCGPSLEPDQARFSIFRPDIVPDSSLQPFYYTERFLNSYYPDPAGKDYLRNCEEWQAYTKGKATIQDIYSVQYEMEADSFLAAYNSKKLEDYKANTFLQWLTKKSNRDALRYMALAKKTEQGQNFNTDAWSTDTVIAAPYSFDSLARVALKECESKTDEFLKERYAFQAVKLWYYDKDTSSDLLIKTYDTYLKNKSTIVSAWGALYYGLVQEDQLERTKYLLYAFDKSEEKKVFVYTNLSNAEINAFEKLNTDTAYTPVIYAVKAMKNPGKALTDIQDVYRFSRNSRYLPLLISREVNKLEDWLLTPEVLGFTSVLKQNEYYREQAGKNSETSFSEYAQKNWAKDRAYLKDVRRQLQLMLESGYPQKDFIRLAIAHLYHLEGNYNVAKSYITEVLPGNDAMKQQLEIEHVVSYIHLNDITTPEGKEHLYSSIKRMEQYGMKTGQDYEANDIGESSDDLSEVLLLLSREYKLKGDIVTAGLIYQKADALVNEYDGYKPSGGFSYWQIAYFDRYASPETIDTLMAFKETSRKNAFDKYISPENWADNNYYLDLKGTILIREKKYKEALEVFNQVPDNFWADNYEYKNYLPKNSILNAGTLLPVESGPVTTYPYLSKKLILADIVRLNDELNKPSANTKRANTYFMLGNAYYNISFYGKAWMMYSYGRSGSESYYAEDARWANWAFFSFYPNSIKYGTTYYKLSDAMNMYYRAYNYAGSNKELAAKALLMLSYCDNAVNGNSNSEEKYHSKYLQQLTSHFAATRTFNLSKTNCPDVGAFINKN